MQPPLRQAGNHGAHIRQRHQLVLADAAPRSSARRCAPHPPDADRWTPTGTGTLQGGAARRSRCRARTGTLDREQEAPVDRVRPARRSAPRTPPRCGRSTSPAPARAAGPAPAGRTRCAKRTMCRCTLRQAVAIGWARSAGADDQQLAHALRIALAEGQTRPCRRRSRRRCAQRLDAQIVQKPHQHLGLVVGRNAREVGRAGRGAGGIAAAAQVVEAQNPRTDWLSSGRPGPATVGPPAVARSAVRHTRRCAEMPPSAQTTGRSSGPSRRQAMRTSESCRRDAARLPGNSRMPSRTGAPVAGRLQRDVTTRTHACAVDRTSVLAFIQMLRRPGLGSTVPLRSTRALGGVIASIPAA